MEAIYRLWKEDDGQDLVEYGLLLVLVAMVAIVVVKGLGQQLSTIFSSVTAQLQQNPLGGN